MKPKKDLKVLKKEVEAQNEKPAELTDDNLALVAGGQIHISYVVDGMPNTGMKTNTGNQLTQGISSLLQ